uniref:Uncharacterized protein n=1 Tax=Arundo donax TaxID=35708 RepID=A0A0A9FN56_ARUDO
MTVFGWPEQAGWLFLRHRIWKSQPHQGQRMHVLLLAA